MPITPMVALFTLALLLAVSFLMGLCYCIVGIARCGFSDDSYFYAILGTICAIALIMFIPLLISGVPIIFSN